MQDFQSIPGLAGRLFGGVAAADVRRVQGPASRCGVFSQAASAQPDAAVKCPRCESTNTKFCYYNNYNLSQPRHFCKSCRRYWTKGGVLRNVPVGGGCRKAKRSSSSSSAPSTPAAPTDAKSQRRASASSSSRSNSGSGSTSPTAVAEETMTTTTTEPPPPTPSSNSNSNIITFTSRSTSYPFASDVPPPAPIFADQAAALASLFAPPPPPPLPVFSFSAQPKMEEAIGSLLLPGPSEEAEAPTSTSTVADMAPFMSLDTGMFELGDASPADYWNGGSCWTDVQDPSVYLP